MSRLSIRSPEDWRTYDFWNLIIALVLAIAVIGFWIKYGGLAASACCSGASAAVNAAAATAVASWDVDGRVTLTGVVKDDASHKRIIEAAAAKYGAGNVVDRLTVDRNFSSSVVLAGEVASVAEKNARSEWAR
ncbi:MAG: BON domain-containing protein, partial [Burkholderiales bacterium]